MPKARYHTVPRLLVERAVHDQNLALAMGSTGVWPRPRAPKSFGSKGYLIRVCICMGVYYGVRSGKNEDKNTPLGNEMKDKENQSRAPR